MALLLLTTVAVGRALILMGQTDARRRRVGLQVNRPLARALQQILVRFVPMSCTLHLTVLMRCFPVPEDLLSA